jgi:hypothetical protein
MQSPTISYDTRLRTAMHDLEGVVRGVFDDMNRPDGDILETVLYTDGPCSQGIDIVPPPYGAEDVGAALAFRVVPAVIAQRHANLAVVAWSGWCGTPGSPVRPSQDPRRTEAIVVVGLDSGGNSLQCRAPIDRRRTAPPRLGELTSDGEAFGRFADGIASALSYVAGRPTHPNLDLGVLAWLCSGEAGSALGRTIRR